MTTIQLPKGLLKALQLIASKDPTRYLLCGTHIKTEGTSAMAEATDGRMLVQVKWKTETESNVDILIPTTCPDSIGVIDTDGTVCFSKKKGASIPRTIYVEDDQKSIRVPVRHYILNVPVLSIDGKDRKYPNTAQVIPADVDKPVDNKSAFSASLMARAMQAMAVLIDGSGSTRKAVTVSQASPIDPIRCEYNSPGDNLHICAVLMPMRGN